jgi:hypothetical protein
MDKSERDEWRQALLALKDGGQVIALLDHIADALEGRVEALKNPPIPAGGIMSCDKHGGYGFTSDCFDCKAAIASAQEGKENE